MKTIGIIGAALMLLIGLFSYFGDFEIDDQNYSYITPIIQPTTQTTTPPTEDPLVPLHVFYYGWFNSTIYEMFDDRPCTWLIANSPAGLWSGNGDIATIQTSGIHWLEYTTGSYETYSLSVQEDYCDAVDAAGGYGIFLDEVSAFPDEDGFTYLSTFYNYAHGLGLKVAFNVGVNTWDDNLMDYCDFINAEENYTGGALSSDENTFKTKVWLTSNDINLVSNAISLTNTALGYDVASHYACPDVEYSSLTYYSNYWDGINE